MRFLRPASRALSHLLRHDPTCHSSSASLLSRHSPFAPLSRALNDPFFSSPFSAPLYTVYEVREDDNNSNSNTNKAEQHSTKQEEVKAAEPQQQQQQQRSNDSRLTRHGDSHRQRSLDRHSHRRHHRHHHHHPLSLFSPFDSLLTSPFLAPSSYQPLDITVDLYSTPTAYQVNAAIPGVRKEDIKLTVEDGVLTIEAERREERGRPAKAAPTPASSTSSTATVASTDTNTAAAQSEQKAVDVEVAPDNADNKAAAASQQQSTAEEATEADDVSVHHQESYYGRVQRSLAVPDDVNVDGLTAKYEDGVLKIELPRIEERKQQAKHISIQ